MGSASNLWGAAGKEPRSPRRGRRLPSRTISGDPKSVIPVSDELFDVYRRFYSYDRTPLNARVGQCGRQFSVLAQGERQLSTRPMRGNACRSHLFLPKNASPPYQTIVLFPSNYARGATSSQNLDYSRFDFIIRSGRALLYPGLPGNIRTAAICGRRGQRHDAISRFSGQKTSSGQWIISRRATTSTWADSATTA